MSKFSELFGLDSLFYKSTNIIYSLLVLNLLWFILSLPFFTIGASTTALFYVTKKIIKGKSPYLFRSFWDSFKKNFKQATIVWLGLVILIFILITNIMNIHLLGSMAFFFVVVQYIALFELGIISIYIFPLLSKYHIKVVDLIKLSFFFANRHIVSTLLSLAAPVGIFLLLNWKGYLIFFSMSLYALWVYFIINKVFKKYKLGGEID